MERSPTNRRWERGWRDLVRLGLLMRRMALDWTLSRKQRVDFRAPPQMWDRDLIHEDRRKVLIMTAGFFGGTG